MKDSRKIEWKQMGQLIAMVVQMFTIITGVFKRLAVGPEILEWLVGSGRDFFEAKLAEIGTEFRRQMRPDYAEMLKWWQLFYQEHFGTLIDVIKIRIPDRPKDGKWRLLIVAQGLANNQVYAVLEKHFTCQNYVGDLNKGIPVNERDPKDGAYAIWVRDVVEADECHKNKSANMVKEVGLKTETLLERMIHELVYFLETKDHLDIQNWTLCFGSRDSGSSVPRASWYGDEFRVDWGDVYDQYDYLRPREVIS